MALEHIDSTTLDPANTIVVATGNLHKLTEIEAILSKVLPDTRFVALGQLSSFDDPEETGTTFLENALIKAEAAVARTGFTAIADDSGLVVDALDGEPGVYSARYAGEHGNDAANNEKLLVKMDGVADADRTARFMRAWSPWWSPRVRFCLERAPARGRSGTRGAATMALATIRCSCLQIRPARRWPS